MMRRLQHHRTLLPPPTTADPPDPSNRVAPLAWTPVQQDAEQQQESQLAVAIVEGSGRPIVHLFDASGQLVDRVPLKPAVKVMTGS